MKISFRKFCLLFMLLENLYVPLKLGFDFRLTFILFSALIVIYPFIYRRVRINTTVVQVVFFSSFVLAGSSILAGVAFGETVKQLALIGFNLLFAYFLISAYDYDIRALFKDYIELIYLASIVGLVQIVSMMVKFRYGADFSYLGFDMQNFTMDLWVIQSWFQEPAYLATAFIPVAFAAICRLMKLTDIISTKRSCVVLLVLVLSQAATGLIGILMAIGIITLSKYSVIRSPVMLVGTMVIMLITSLGFYSIPKIQDRVNDTVKLFFAEHATGADIESVNVSTYAIYSNFKIVTAAFLDHPFTGGGLGTYEKIYEHYVHRVMPDNRYTDSLELNKKDANSLMLRLIAETGLIGLLLFFLFVFLFRIKASNVRTLSPELMDYWIINSGVYVVIIVRLIRLGHYTILGFVVFLVVYYISKQCYVRATKQSAEPLAIA